MLNQIWILLTKATQFLQVYTFNRKKLPKFLNKTLIELGPVYVKLGQVCSTRSDIFSQEYIAELSKLRNNCPFESENVIRVVLDQAYPLGIDQIFANFDYQPVAAGAVAQVHAAKLHDGNKVAVKVLRPGIRKEIDANFKFILFIVTLMEKFSSNIRALNVRYIVEELYELLVSQTNLRQEVLNYLQFQDVYRDDDTLIVPKVYEELSSSEVMVMEFVEAIEPYEFDKLASDRLSLASKVDYMLDNMFFIKGLCHADLHPGNFFWNRKRQIVVIDLGLIHQVSQEDRNKIAIFYFCLVDEFYDLATEYFLKHFVSSNFSLFERENSTFKEEVFNSAYKIIKEQVILTGGRPRFSAICQQILKLMSTYHLQLKPNFSKILLSLATVEGYLYAIDPAFDMLENARQKRLNQAEYTSIPLEAERIILGDYGTYSAAMFKQGFTARQAWEERDRYVLDQLGIMSGQFFIDVGCGRGQLLSKAKERGARSLGITISRFEYETCLHKDLECMWTSWEQFGKNDEKSYPKADAMAVIEMLFHLATFYENKAGLLEKRLQRFFVWAHDRLTDGGKLFIQSLNISSDFLDKPCYQDDFQRITDIVPWLGFTTLKQIINCSEKYFEVQELCNNSTDLLSTCYIVKNRMSEHEVNLAQLIKPDIYKYMRQELDVIIELTERNLLSLNRILLFQRSRSANISDDTRKLTPLFY